MSEANTLLGFDEVCFPERLPEYGALNKIGFKLAPGGTALFAVPSRHVSLSLADLACGVVNPERGSVLFDGNDWNLVPPRKAASLRGGITRVFAFGGLISNLDIDENILLPSLHHTERPRNEIMAEAVELGKRFGLSELSAVRPAFVSAAELKIWEWVRALLGKPSLIIMDHAFLGVGESDLDLLVNAVEEKRKTGAAVMWLESDPDIVSRLVAMESDLYIEIRNE